MTAAAHDAQKRAVKRMMGAFVDKQRDIAKLREHNENRRLFPQTNVARRALQELLLFIMITHVEWSEHGFWAEHAGVCDRLRRWRNEVRKKNIDRDLTLCDAAQKANRYLNALFIHVDALKNIGVSILDKVNDKFKGTEATAGQISNEIIRVMVDETWRIITQKCVGDDHLACEYYNGLLVWFTDMLAET
jgi:hypothetical protein